MAPNMEGFAVLLRTLIVVACMASGLLPLVEDADTTIIGGETRVIDGDTLEVKGERVRLQGVDAPEKGQSCESASGKRYPCGQEAIRALRERIGESKVACAIDAQRDRYGRALGVCSLRGGDQRSVVMRTGSSAAWASCASVCWWNPEPEGAQRHG
jgi:endonuclease YncB( thermonuclease family)